MLINPFSINYDMPFYGYFTIFILCTSTTIFIISIVIYWISYKLKLWLDILRFLINNIEMLFEKISK